RLLHALARDIARDRRVLIFAPDLIDFIDVDDSGLGPAHITVGGLQQFEDDVLHILAYVPGLGQGGGIDDGEGNIQHARQSLCQQRLTRPGGADQHDVRLGQFDAVAGLLAVHEDPLVVVVNRDRQLLLSLLLPDDELIEERFYFLGLGQLVGSGGLGSCRAVVFQNRVTYRHALVANIGSQTVGGGPDQVA